MKKKHHAASAPRHPWLQGGDPHGLAKARPRPVAPAQGRGHVRGGPGRHAGG